MAKPQKTSDKGKEQSYSHLKWPAIIIGVLIVLLVIVFDHCTRQGEI